MKRTTVLLLAALALACSRDTTAPGASTDELLDEANTLASSASFVADPAGNFLPPLGRLPENLKLTNDQLAKIKSLTEAFRAATKADHDALAAIEKQAKEAARAGKSRAEVEAIMHQGDAIRARLQAAEDKFHADVLAVLTAAQRAWLESNKPAPCATLTDAQKTQVAALVAAYEQANKADLDAVKAAHDKAAAAAKDGATREQVQAILDAVKPNMERLSAALKKLQSDIEALLTAEQKAAKCLRLPEPPQPRKGR